MIKHHFERLFSTSLCKVCKKPKADHIITGNCESCSNTDCLVQYNDDDILLCETCVKRDIEIKAELEATDGKMYPSVEVPILHMPSDAGIAELITVAKAIEIDNALTTSQEFFNAETVSINDIVQAISRDTEIDQDKKHFELVRVIRERFKHFRSVLFEIKKLEVEISSRERALQYKLNDIATQFSHEERERLKLQDLSYVPREIAPKAPKIKMSAEDKLIDSYAKLMNVSVEQARSMFKNKMKEQTK